MSCQNIPCFSQAASCRTQMSSSMSRMMTHMAGLRRRLETFALLPWTFLPSRFPEVGWISRMGMRRRSKLKTLSMRQRAFLLQSSEHVFFCQFWFALGGRWQQAELSGAGTWSAMLLRGFNLIWVSSEALEQFQRVVTLEATRGSEVTWSKRLAGVEYTIHEGWWAISCFWTICQAEVTRRTS